MFLGSLIGGVIGGLIGTVVIGFIKKPKTQYVTYSINAIDDKSVAEYLKKHQDCILSHSLN